MNRSDNLDTVATCNIVVAKTALEIAYNQTIFDPLNDRCETLAVDYPDLCAAVIGAAGGDQSGLQRLHKNQPELFEFVFHYTRSKVAQYDSRLRELFQEGDATEKQDQEKFIPSPAHTCGGYSLESDLLTTFYRTGNVRKKRKFHSKRVWRTCPGCAHDRILREVPKIQEEQKLYNLFYTIMVPADYRKMVSRFTTWRNRAMSDWHEAIAKLPDYHQLCKDAPLESKIASPRMPKPPHDIVYIGYKIAGAIVVVHNQKQLTRRATDQFDLVPMPTEKQSIYDLIGQWVADAPQTDTRQFVVGSRGFGKDFAGTRAVKKSDSADSEFTKNVTSLKFKFPSCSQSTEKTIDRILKMTAINSYGLGRVEISVAEFRGYLESRGIEHEIVGGEDRYSAFVTQLAVIQTKPYDDDICHKPPPKKEKEPEPFQTSFNVSIWSTKS